MRILTDYGAWPRKKFIFLGVVANQLMFQVRSRVHGSKDAPHN